MPPDKPNSTPADRVVVPKAVVNRLSLYLRELQHLRRHGKETISSQALGERLGFSDAQVRKDLAYFGHFGQPGIGYRAFLCGGKTGSGDEEGRRKKKSHA